MAELRQTPCKFGCPSASRGGSNFADCPKAAMESKSAEAHRAKTKELRIRSILLKRCRLWDHRNGDAPAGRVGFSVSWFGFFLPIYLHARRSEERRVGKECRSR